MSTDPAIPTPTARCGLVAIVGRANVGKSTLLNSILEEKVSIVSPVAQTTRTLVRAILTEPRGQLVFLDTPGVHKAAHDLGRTMNRIARDSIAGVDIVLLVLDASEAPREEDAGWMSRLMGDEAHCVALLNKADRKPGHAAEFRELWGGLAFERKSAKTPEWVAASGLTGQGVPELVDLLFRTVPEGPLLFPGNILTDYPRKLNIADVVREKYFAVLREELPHAMAVEIETVDEKEDGWKAAGSILVEKDSQKGIVLGGKGRLLKRVRQEAEKELAEMYGRPVSLDLWVKVEKGWSRNYWMLKRLGYVR
jgi:GTPase